MHSRTAWHRPGPAANQTAPRTRIREIAHARPRYGATGVGILQRREGGGQVNKKRTHRLYSSEGLQGAVAGQASGTAVQPRSRAAAGSTGAWISSLTS
ncbi:MAG: transposase [Gemmatimonadaceae bacterium]|nr:transposase [Gemmatimonadaceae bacterium]